MTYYYRAERSGTARLKDAFHLHLAVQLKFDFLLTFV